MENGLRKEVGAAVVILTLLFSTITALTPSTASGEEATLTDFTHTPFVESGSATW